MRASGPAPSAATKYSASRTFEERRAALLDHRSRFSSESAFQAELVTYLEGAYAFGPLLFAVPNGGYRTWRQGAILKREGVKPGTADVFVMRPSGIGRNIRHGLIIELKQPNNRPSPEQLEFMEALNRFGYVARWVDTWLDALELVQDYVNGRIK